MTQWIVNAIVHSILILGFPLAYSGYLSAWNSQGLIGDQYFLGVVVYTIMIAALNAKVNNYTMLIFMMLLLEFLLFYPKNSWL
jgi:hypothetical protein